MTAVVAIEDTSKKTVYMGADSCGIAGLNHTVRDDPKVFINGPFIMAFTSSFRMGNLLNYKVDPPKQSVKQSDIQYMNTDFIDHVREVFNKNGYGTPASGGTFLVGYNGKLYTVDNDFQIGIPHEKYDAAGCGAPYALGALFATKGKKPEERIKIALEAATFNSAGVLPPYRMLKLTASSK